MVKQIPLAGESSHTDANQQFSIVGVQGTLGTSDVAGTAATMAFSGDPATGAMYVNNIGTAGGGASGTYQNIVGGTQQTLGTVGTVNGIGTITNLGSITSIGSIGTIAGITTGTYINVATGTQQTLGTVGTIPGVGIVTRIGNIGTIESGTITSTLALNTGTLTTIAAGTQNTLGTIGVLNAGSVVVTVGTIGGKAASGAAAVANPVLVAGTDAGGTIYAPLITSAGALSVTGASAGTFVNVVTGTLTAGTISAGTISAGTINAGTFVITAGTFGGKAASGAAAVANPVQIAGTDAGGTIYSPLITTAGAQLTGLTSSGTVLNLATGTLASVAAVTSVTNLVGGTLFTGTVVNNGGTIQNLNFGTIAIDPIPARGQVIAGTIGTTGVSIFGTLAGGTSSGAGTEIFVTGLSIVIPASAGSQDVSIGFGTNAGTVHTGTSVLARGMFVAGGGISKTFQPAINSGTNAQVTYFQSAAGTAVFNITYFTAATTL